MSETEHELFEAMLARVEARLVAVVNERTTRVIDATTAVIGGLHEEIQANGEAMEQVSAQLVNLRGTVERYMATTDARLATLADLIPGGAEALDLPPLRETVAAQGARLEALEGAQTRQAARLDVVTIGVGLAVLLVLVMLAGRAWGWV